MLLRSTPFVPIRLAMEDLFVVMNGRERERDKDRDRQTDRGLEDIVYGKKSSIVNVNCVMWREEVK